MNNPPPPTEGLVGWFTGRLPDEWFTGPATVVVDREEISVVGELAAPETDRDAGPEVIAYAERGRIKRFRETTREERMQIAREAEHRFGRSVAWGARVGDTDEQFTSLSVPVMTRLRQPERLVLDTLVDSGVARSRSEALAWCVRLVGDNAGSWLDELREAMQAVQKVRENGPSAG